MCGLSPAAVIVCSIALEKSNGNVFVLLQLCLKDTTGRRCGQASLSDRQKVWCLEFPMSVPQVA